MNDDQSLICCPVCTIKYTNYHTRCPKCGTPKPEIPNIINTSERVEIIPKQISQPTPNVTIQQEQMQPIPMIVPTNTYNPYNYNQYNQMYNQNTVNYDLDTKSTIENLYKLSTLILIITLIVSILLALMFLISFSEESLLGTLITIILIPGPILLIGIIISQVLKWKALMLYQIQNKK